MFQCFASDLHVHTCLSPCADLTMSPKRVAERARSGNVHLLGVCDHNSAENVEAAVCAGAKNGVSVLPGMEVTTAEEVHIVGLFPRSADALRLQRIVYDKLPPDPNQPDVFGEQIIASDNDDVEGYNGRLLSAATALTVDEAVKIIHELGGLAIAAHIDRERNGIIGQLGFIPEGLPVDAVEIAFIDRLSETQARNPEIGKYPVIAASDAHSLKDIGRIRTIWTMAEPTISEIRLALKDANGRSMRIGT